MSVKFCQHVKVDGTLCQVPPLRGRHHCHFHLDSLGRRIRMARAQARREKYHLVLPVLEDLNSVQVARQQVMDALNAGLIETKHAGLLLYGLQGMASDLRSAAPPRLGVYDPAVDTAPRAEEYANFEQVYEVSPELDLSQPPEVLLAAEAAGAAREAQATAQAERSAYRSNPWHDVQWEDVELEEILFTQGQEAHDKRSAELQRREWKRIEREKQELAHAHQMVEAARRNERPWTSGRQKGFYEKCVAEHAAREKAREEDIAAMKAAALAQVEARKAREGQAGDGDTPAAGEAGKKPVAAVSGESGAGSPQEKRSGA